MALWDDLLADLEEHTSEDRVRYERIRSDGTRRLDFETVEQTVFAHGLPATTKSLIWNEPLDCGHPATKESACAGECQGLVGLRKRPCRREFCAQCRFQCPRCAAVVSVQCCVGKFEDAWYCKRCATALRRRWLLASLGRLLRSPFTAVTEDDDGDTW